MYDFGTRPCYVVWWHIGAECTPTLLKDVSSWLKLRLPTNLHLPGSGSVMIDARDSADTMVNMIHEAHDYAWIYLGTSRQHQKSYCDISTHGSPFEIADCVWFYKACSNSWRKPRIIAPAGRTIHNYKGIVAYILYVTQAWLASVWAICSSLK